MNKIIHKGDERGKAEYDWLKTRYSFSFGEWHDPNRMGFGALRVINDDIIAPGTGFGTHGHRDMEIITIVTKGEVAHQDSLGNNYTIHEGEVQVMSAGTGIVHSEYNASNEEELHLFQIWIEPNIHGALPRYEQKEYSLENKLLGITLLVGPNHVDTPLAIYQNAWISHVALDSSHPIPYTLMKENDGVYIFVIDGHMTVAEEVLEAKDAIEIWNNGNVVLSTTSTARALIIEVPMQ